MAAGKRAGTVCVQKEGARFPIQEKRSIMMNDGTKVFGTGRIVGPADQETYLSNGEILTLPGVVSNLVISSSLPVAETNRVPRFGAGPAVPGADEKISTNLAGASPEQLLRLYADLTHRRKGKLAVNLSPTRIDFRADTLSCRETVPALALIAVLHSLAFVSTADGAVDLELAAGARQ